MASSLGTRSWGRNGPRQRARPSPESQVSTSPRRGGRRYLIPVSTVTTISVKTPGSTVTVWGFANGGEVSDTIDTS